MLRDLCRGLADLVAPAACATCRGPVEDAPDPLAAVVCAACRAELEPGGFLTDPHLPVVAALRYRGPARRLVHQLKYDGRTDLARPFGRLLATAVAAEGRLDPTTLVVPVPLHWMRRLVRGFNQAELLAREVASALGLTVEPRALGRLARTRALHGVPRGERAAVVAGVFRADPRRVAGRAVLLVDDVRTSGATLEASARALAAAGAAAIGGAVLAARVRR